MNRRRIAVPRKQNPSTWPKRENEKTTSYIHIVAIKLEYNKN